MWGVPNPILAPRPQTDAGKLQDLRLAQFATADLGKAIGRTRLQSLLLTFLNSYCIVHSSVEPVPGTGTGIGL